VGFVDPHGEAANDVLDFVPKNRINDVIYFNPADLDYPIGFNVMENVSEDRRHLVASGLMGVFKKIWPDVWSARMEYILNNCILALLEYPDSTLLSVNRMLADEQYRNQVVEKIKDPIVKSFWVNEFARYTQRYEVEATAAIQNKIGQFISSPLIRNIIGQVRSTINIREIMDSGKIFIMDLSKGRIGEESSKLLGGLLITEMQISAMSRVDIPEEQRKDFFLYVDEFQNFATESFANILSEARKYRLSLVLSHQYIAQMEDMVRDAVFGNVGTIILFRIGAQDADFLEKEFAPRLNMQDLVNLAKYHIYVKLMIDGVAADPFSAFTLPPLPKPDISYRDTILRVSRERYARPREAVEEAIARWTGNFVLQKQTKKMPELYDAVCQKCQKEIKVPFKPDNTRPVYCKSCLKKMGEENTEQPTSSALDPTMQKTSSLEELLLKHTVSFSRKAPKQEKKEQSSIDQQQLRQLIDESLQTEQDQKSFSNEPGNDLQQKESQKDSLGKKIEPGQIINFEQ
jgi:CxxC-x17-CxxC domain-containing protein